MNRAKGAPSGFSLIEMALILMVVGVLVTTFLPKMISRMQLDVTKKNVSTLESTRDEVRVIDELTQTSALGLS